MRQAERKMQIFIDSADAKELAKLAETGLVDGVTTNPSLVAKSGGNFFETLQAICASVPGPVSAEVVAQDYETMVKEGHKLRTLAQNIVVKLPLTPDGLRACKTLEDEGHPCNVTLCFSAVQALLAAKAGATFISPFLGRLDDNGQDGMGLIREIRAIYDNFDFPTQILAASIRTAAHVRDAALAGADCATIPPAVFKSLYKHVLTDAGLEAFLKDWKSTGQSIL
jgi:transaldolase